jgi:hypothetical protein
MSFEYKTADETLYCWKNLEIEIRNCNEEMKIQVNYFF